MPTNFLCRTDNGRLEEICGLTKRDWFAGVALQGLITAIDRIDMETWMKGMSHEAIANKFAHDAYMTADAMLTERSKNGTATNS